MSTPMTSPRSTPQRRRRRIADTLRAGVVVLLLLVACRQDEDAARPGPVVWPMGDLVAVAAPAPDRAILANRAGRIFRTRDGGRTWQRGRTPVIDGLAALAMVDAESGFAVGPGALLYTADGGARWERQRLPGPSAQWPLLAIGVLDAKRAVVLAEGGRWLVTVDGGGVWREGAGLGAVAPGPTDAALALEADAAAPSRLVAIDCVDRRRAASLCWAVGDAVVAIDPESDFVAARGLADAAGLPLFRFRSGGVELRPPDRDLLAEAARRLARAPVAWRVEAFVTAEEIRRFAEDQDPSALFDRIAARTGEVVARLEAAGVAPARITVNGAPPWGYEEYLDDDPEFLARYWAARLAPVPSVAVRAREQVSLLAVLASEEGLVAGDASGRIFVGEADVAPLAVVARPADHALLALASVGNAVIAVGRQGEAHRGVPTDAGLRFAAARMGPGGDFFQSLRAVAFEPGGALGWVVGDQGRIARSRDGGRSWTLVGAETGSRDSAAVRP